MIADMLDWWKWPGRVVWAGLVFAFVMFGVIPFAVTGMVLREVGEAMCARVGWYS